MKATSKRWGVLAAVFLAAAACTVQLEQTSAVSTPVPATETQALPTATATVTPLPVTPTATEEGATGVPEAAARPFPTDWFGFPYLDDSMLDYEILAGWQDLGLEGSVLFLSNSQAGQAVVVFDFAAGRFAPIFVVPENTWVLSASANPNRSDVLLSYAPVPPEGETQYGYTDLYRLSPDGTLVPLLERTEAVESFFAAFYSNSGEDVFYSWFVIDDTVDYGFRYHINSLDLETGVWGTIVEDAFWQNVSADDGRLAYVTLDPNAAIDAPAELLIVPAGGGAPVAALDPEQFPTVDAPFFSPDGRYLYFSAVSEEPPALSWLDRLMGVIPVSAHNVPSDWWRVDLETGGTARVSQVFDQGLFGDFSPEGDRIAFISSAGLWVMNPDGSGLVQVISSNLFYGNVEWVR